MHIVTILAYACLFWRAAGPITPEPLVAGPTAVLVLVASQPVLLAVVAWLVSRRTLRRLVVQSPAIGPLQLYHRTVVVLRAALLVGFAVVVLATSWPRWFRLAGVAPELQVLADSVVLAPFVAGAIAIWVSTFKVESALRSAGAGLFRANVPSGGICSHAARSDASPALLAAEELEILRCARNDLEGARAPTERLPAMPSNIGMPKWGMWNYLDFNIRHQFLVVAAPMTLVLFAANLTGGYERQLREWSGWVWTPDVVLAGAAALVFVTSPLLLRRIWRTESMPPGDVRSGLEALCRRIGLSVRDILIWRSDGLMINAAVMGVVSPLRYVLLSDGLLATMSPQQVEAVFGHEAGHVRHRHILHFLMFALVGWIATATVMEAAAQTAVWAEADPSLWVPLVQAIGVTGTLLFWGIGFGWLSRRFERQADAFAARCAAPALGECGMPCSVHLDANTSREADGRVCASGAALFASALDQVALLNAIPRNEPSWRHSSIASRVRFLMSLAEDPAKAVRFERLIRRVKAGMLAAALIGLAAWAGYWLAGAGPAIVQVQAGLR